MDRMHEGQLVGGRYRLGAPLGRGAMGQVFRATDERLRRDVAVKLVDLTSVTDPTVAERFNREAQATARLNHPGIVTMFDADSDGRTAYLVMELLPGRPLSQVLREGGPLPVDEAVRVAGQVAGALVATHTIGVVHRDIKPANIMIDGPSVKLLDFGIALVALDAGVSLTAPATTLGTAAYMSPEQARGERATPASDVYALGGVLVAMLTGRPPYSGDNAVQVAHRHLTEPPPSVRALRPDVPADVDALVARMLAKAPSERPDAAAVVVALAGLGSAARLGSASPVGEPVEPPVQRGPAMVPPSAALRQAQGATAGMPAGASAATAVLPATAALRQAQGASGTAVMPAATAVLPTQHDSASGEPPGGQPPSARRRSSGPDSGGPYRPGDSTFRKAALWVGLLIAALLVFTVTWAMGSTLVRGIGTGAATPASTSTPRTTTPTKAPTTAPATKSPVQTTPALPTSAKDAGLKAAVAGVGLAIGTIDTGRDDAASKAATQLRAHWAATRDDVLAGNNAAKRVELFRADVERQRKSGAITVLETETIKVALSGVEAAL